MSAKVQGRAWEQALLPQRKLLLWLTNHATDAGACFPPKRELAEQTGLSERMVRYQLAWLASDRDEDGRPEAPLQIIKWPVGDERSTSSNVYVLRVPWAQPEEVRAELAEISYVPAARLERVSATGCWAESQSSRVCS